MRRRTYSSEIADHMSGHLAQHDGTCWTCDGAITRLVSQVVLRRGRWVHVGCVPGADDE